MAVNSAHVTFTLLPGFYRGCARMCHARVQSGWWFSPAIDSDASLTASTKVEALEWTELLEQSEFVAAICQRRESFVPLPLHCTYGCAPAAFSFHHAHSHVLLPLPCTDDLVCSARMDSLGLRHAGSRTVEDQQPGRWQKEKMGQRILAQHHSPTPEGVQVSCASSPSPREVFEAHYFRTSSGGHSPTLCKEFLCRM